MIWAIGLLLYVLFTGMCMSLAEAPRESGLAWLGLWIVCSVFLSVAVSSFWIFKFGMWVFS